MGRTTGHYCPHHDPRIAMLGLYSRMGSVFKRIGYVCPECNHIEFSEV